jgi:hypothetical protein
MKPKQEPKETDPRIKTLIDAFHQKHIERHGCSPLRPEYGRFAKELKAMLVSADANELVTLMDDFFSTRDPRVVRSDYKPMDFVYLAQHLRLRRNGRKDYDERTQRDVHAAMRASGKY